MIENLQSFQNVFKIPELKRRVLVTAGLLVAYRLGAHVPTPGIDGHALSQFFDQVQNTLLGMVDLFSGGNLRRLSIFALGIMPYISASIILQLLTVVIPTLERLAKEGEAGRKKITQYTRYGTIVLSAVQSLGIAYGLESMRSPEGLSIVPTPGATDAKIGCSRPTTSGSPPIIRQKPRSSPQTPPLVPTSRWWRPFSASAAARRMSSR